MTAASHGRRFGRRKTLDNFFTTRAQAALVRDLFAVLPAASAFSSARRGHRHGDRPDTGDVDDLSGDFGGRTEIEFFDGPHTIHGEGTFRFLHRHLNWPASR